MSLDYTCYAPKKRPLTPAQVSAAAPAWFFAFVNAGTSKLLPDSRSLPSYCLVWGCRRSARVDLAELVRAGAERLSEFAEKGKIGCCELQIEANFEADLEYLDDLPLLQRLIIEGSKSCYETRTSAGQNDLAWELQRAVCRAVASVAGGLLEDPQSGKFRTIYRPNDSLDENP